MLIFHEDAKFLGNAFMEMMVGAEIMGIFVWVTVTVRVKGFLGFIVGFRIFLCFVAEFMIFCFRIVSGVKALHFI
jgi:hypothetical protein